jgi:hypothetical protein
MRIANLSAANGHPITFLEILVPKNPHGSSVPLLRVEVVENESISSTDKFVS